MRLAFPEVAVYAVAGPKWLKTKKGSVNLIFFGGAPVASMKEGGFMSLVSRLLNQDQFPAEGFAFFGSQSPIELGPGLILTDDFSPLDLLQGEA